MDKKRLEKLFNEIDNLLNLSPCEDDCTDEENEVLSDMANLKESLSDLLF